jgi:hypothetical protein
MPFPLIPTALAVGFLVMWVLIATMLLRDGQLAARRERESQSHIVPLKPSRTTAARAASSQQARRAYRKSRIRAAS